MNGNRFGGPFMWSVQEFATSVLGSQSKHKALAMLCSYFDESGITTGSPSVIVAGVVARADSWDEIKEAWRSKLGEFNLTQYHAVDCEHGIGEFSPYSRPIRDSLTKYFAGLLASVQCQAFASAIPHKEWKSHAPDELKRHFRNDPFYLAFELTLQQISEWSVLCADAEPVGIVFSRQDEYAERATEIYKRYSLASKTWPGIGSISFADPRLLAPLQAADLLAYEVHSYIKHREKPLRPALEVIQNGAGRMALSFMEHNAVSLANALNGPRRYWRNEDVGSVAVDADRRMADFEASIGRGSELIASNPVV